MEGRSTSCRSETRTRRAKKTQREPRSIDIYLVISKRRAKFAESEAGLPRPGTVRSGLLDLAELQLHRGRAAENQHRHAQAALLVVDFLDHAVEVVERA